MKKLLVFSLIIFCSCKLNAQQFLATEKTADTSSIGKLALYDLKNGIKNVGHSFSRPFHWKKKDLSTLATVLVSALALSTIDDEASELFIRNEPHVPILFQEVGTRFGSPQVYFIANAGLYGVGLFTKNEKIRKTSILIISSSFTSGIIQSLSKTAFGRSRPKNGLKSTEFRFWSREPGLHSFPSGHTVLSVTMAHAIAKQFDNTWTKIGIYTLGSVAPISRLFAGAHWPTDVGVAAVLSIVVVDSIDKFMFNSNSYKYNKKEKLISWRLSFTGDKIGLIGSF
ncbi:hypothetical protein GCM10023314_19720 [Algibacter agarivorans]|uniref:Phosphatidic acid phosphatase type 2/haloperoxidase domain-containing protein n=1 Tax=Algibacter agarivorans TaxID=1109741 RepID=A0ABP9GTW2_9FLAO